MVKKHEIGNSTKTWKFYKNSNFTPTRETETLETRSRAQKTRILA